MARTKPPLLGVTAAAALLHLSAKQVVNLANQNKLPCQRDSSNKRLFLLKDVARLMKERQKLPASSRNVPEIKVPE